MFQIGTGRQRLIDVKAKLPHGQFGQWLRDEFDWSERAARRTMEVASNFKTANLADMNIAPSALYLLASDSTPGEVRDQFIEQAKSGDAVGKPCHYNPRRRIADCRSPGGAVTT